MSRFRPTFSDQVHRPSVIGFWASGFGKMMPGERIIDGQRQCRLGPKQADLWIAGLTTDNTNLTNRIRVIRCIEKGTATSRHRSIIGKNDRLFAASLLFRQAARRDLRADTFLRPKRHR